MKNSILSTLWKFIGTFGLKKAWELYQKYVETSEDHVRVVVTLDPSGLTESTSTAKIISTAPNGDVVISFVVSTRRISGFLDGTSLPLPFNDGKKLVLNKIKSVELWGEQPTNG